MPVGTATCFLATEECSQPGADDTSPSPVQWQGTAASGEREGGREEEGREGGREGEREGGSEEGDVRQGGTVVLLAHWQQSSRLLRQH